MKDWQNELTIESHFNDQKLDYYYLKVKFYQIFKDLDNSRRFLYKIDLFIRDHMDDDLSLRTEYLVLLAINLADHKELLTAHYMLYNWLQKIEDVEGAYPSIFKTQL